MFVGKTRAAAAVLFLISLLVLPPSAKAFSAAPDGIAISVEENWEPRNPRNLAMPRTLIATSAALAAGAVWTGVMWANRSSSVEACGLGNGCVNREPLERAHRAYRISTLVLGGAALMTAAAGGAWLFREKSKERRLSASFGASRHAAHLSATLSFEVMRHDRVRSATPACGSA